MSSADPQADKHHHRLMWAVWSVSAVVAIVLFIILARLVSGGGAPSASSTPQLAPAALISKLTNIPADIFSAVGQGSVTDLPKAISAPALASNGKPEVLYIGAEYCPYCATERWPMIIALSHFGTFSGLSQTTSSASDVYPSTPTFTFHGATYISKYITFVARETNTNQAQGTSYAPLDVLTSAQKSLLNTYDAPPYVSSSSAGAIPFIYFGGQYLISGSTYSPAVLQNNSADGIADSLTQTNSDISKGAIGSANVITATICKLINNQASACSWSAVKSIEGELGS